MNENPSNHSVMVLARWTGDYREEEEEEHGETVHIEIERVDNGDMIV